MPKDVEQTDFLHRAAAGSRCRCKAAHCIANNRRADCMQTRSSAYRTANGVPEGSTALLS